MADSSIVPKRRHRAAFYVASLLALAACGGGGDDTAGPAPVQGPPTAPAAISASPTEAAAAARSSVEAAVRAAELSISLDQMPLPLMSGGAAAFAATSREQAQARETLECAGLFGAGCTGSVTFDSSLQTSSTAVPAGSYLAITFNTVRMIQPALQLDGSLRLDFLTAYDLNATSLANQRIQIRFENLVGIVDGFSFGPYNMLALVEFDASARSTLTMDGLRLSRLENASVTDASNFSMNGVAVRREGWTTAQGYVDFDFGNWVVAGSRPTLGSTVTVSGGSNRVVVTVSSSSAAQVVYDVTINVGSVVTRYTVTASYPGGGGAPIYTAVPIA